MYFTQLECLNKWAYPGTSTSMSVAFADYDCGFWHYMRRVSPTLGSLYQSSLFSLGPVCSHLTHVTNNGRYFSIRPHDMINEKMDLQEINDFSLIDPLFLAFVCIYDAWWSFHRITQYGAMRLSSEEGSCTLAHSLS